MMDQISAQISDEIARQWGHDRIEKISLNIALNAERAKHAQEIEALNKQLENAGVEIEALKAKAAKAKT